MKHTYITAVLRDQLNLLFRFGYTDIPSVLIYRSDKEVEKSIMSLFSKLTPYYDESHYILIEFESINNFSNGDVLRIDIQDIIKIYPLSRLAAATMKQSRLDERIRIEEPIFEHLLYDIENLFRKNNLLRSVKALWSICEINNTPEGLLSIIGIENIMTGIGFRKKGIKANMINDHNYWSYLIAYDSYNLNFPSSTLGYFYDAGEVFAFSNNQETFVGSKYYKFLEKINLENPNCTLQEIVKEIEFSNEISAYKEKATHQGIKAYLVAPIFLMLKDDLRKELELSKTKLGQKNYLLKVGGEDFKAALILLASFFGFDKFYDSFYDKLKLRFFKTYRPEKDKNDVTEKVYSDKNAVISEPTLDKGTLVSDENLLSENNLKIVERNLEIEQQTSGQLLDQTEQTLTEDETKYQEQKIALKDNQESTVEFSGKDNIKSKIKNEILPPDNKKNKLSKNPIKHKSSSNLKNVTDSMLKKIINDLLIEKSEIEIKDLIEKIKEVSGQKITDKRIIKVIETMGNVEIDQKDKGASARKTIIQDLFNKQV
jgi:hypothetical protein